MKTIQALIVAILLGVSVAAAAHAGDPADEASGQVVTFYKYYLHAIKGEGDTLKKTRAMQKRYVSDRFLREIDKQVKSPDGLESDPYILAQDWDDAWEKTARAKEAFVSGEKASVGLELSGGEMGVRVLEIKLVHGKEGWKIDKVRELDTHKESHVEKP